MIDAHAATSTDITDLILIEHEEIRTRFRQLWGMLGPEDDGARAMAWRVLADLMEAHAKAEEELLHPLLLRRGSDQSPAEPTDPLGDHSRIRDAVTSAARGASGTALWWASVQACRTANDLHLAAEERDVIPNLRMHTDSELRSESGVRWLAFRREHRATQGIPGQVLDVTAFVRANS